MLRKSHSSEWHASTSSNNGNYNGGAGFSTGEAAAHSIALQQHFEELKAEVNDFTFLFASWTASRRRVLDEDKEAYLKTLSEESDLVEALKRQLTQLVTKRQQIVADLQAEQKEFEDGQRANKDLDDQRQTLTKKITSLKDRVGKATQELTNEQGILSEKQKIAKTAAFKELLEITLGQEKLGLTVDREGEHATRFSFKYIDPTDWERKFIIAIDVSTSKYRIKYCEPMLPSVSNLIIRLDEDGDFYAFLRRIRQAFVDLISTK